MKTIPLGGSRQYNAPMADLGFLALILGFFALCLVFVQACERMIGPDPRPAEEQQA